jgi:hypothetical protein
MEENMVLVVRGMPSLSILIPFFCGGPTVEVPLFFCLLATFKREEKGRRSMIQLRCDRGERMVSWKRQRDIVEWDYAYCTGKKK